MITVRCLVFWPQRWWMRQISYRSSCGKGSLVLKLTFALNLGFTLTSVFPLNPSVPVSSFMFWWLYASHRPIVGLAGIGVPMHGAGTRFLVRRKYALPTWDNTDGRGWWPASRVQSVLPRHYTHTAMLMLGLIPKHDRCIHYQDILPLLLALRR